MKSRQFCAEVFEVSGRLEATEDGEKPEPHCRHPLDGEQNLVLAFKPGGPARVERSDVGRRRVR